MESPIKLDLSESANRAVDNLTGEPLKTVGQILSDLLFVCFGRISYEADKRRLKYARNLELFSESLIAKVNAIPPEKLIEPDTQKILGALDDAKFCVDHEELRIMFENLIAASLSSDTASFVHPSFSHIIRYMSVLDAKIIALFASKLAYPIAEFRVYLENSGFFTSFTNAFLPEVGSATLDEKAASLLSLSSFGLITLSYSNFFLKSEVYDEFKTTEEFLNLEEKMKMLPQALEKAEIHDPIKIQKVEIGKGRADLTELGVNFLTICGYQVLNKKLIF